MENLKLELFGWIHLSDLELELTEYQAISI
jgi:hypothetical protein